MTRVPFGSRSSPFLLAATIRHHVQTLTAAYLHTTTLLSCHFYVDDLIVGADTVDEAVTIYHQARDVLHGAGMRIVKWTSNHSTLQHIFEADGTTNTSAISPRKVLGLSWDIESNEIRYSLKSLSEFLESRTDTKRYVLQAVSRVYDPLRYIAPYVITAKILIQRIWLSRCGWDERLPADLMAAWLTWCQAAHRVSCIAIPRRLTTAMVSFCEVSKTLHVFSDASTRACGAAVHLVTQYANGPPEATLVLAKTGVAPVKPVSLPRLELMGAVIASRLLRLVKATLSLSAIEAVSWTDSKITLHWMNGNPRAWKPFVQSRVSKIHTIAFPSQW